MKQDPLQYDVRKDRFYKDIYRSSLKPSRFLGTLLAILLQGRSQLGSPYVFRRRH